jgi:serine protease
VSVSSIELEAAAYALVSYLHASDVEWSGAEGTSVDIYRNGSRVTTATNNGYYSDWIWFPTGTTYSYKVCQAGSTRCSPTVTAEAQSGP